MKLRGIEFGNILGASGVQGFSGEGYWFHKPFGLNFKGMTFVSKTSTYEANKGNMPLTSRFTPRYPFPRCIRAKPFRGLMLNSVGLSNPGLRTFLILGKWAERTEPFFISIMSIAKSREQRLEEFRKMAVMLELAKREFKAPFGLQINLSCPNTGHDPAELIGESEDVLNIFAPLGVPLMPKYSIATAPTIAVAKLQNHPVCDAICVSNTIPFGWEGLDWKKVWGTDKSPIAHLGGGGLSGKELLPLVCSYIDTLRNRGFTKPINGGGGILTPLNVRSYRNAGASSVFIGSVATLRPWRVQKIITEANRINWS